MKLKQWIKTTKEVDEVAGQVAEQLKLTLDRSDALDLLKEMEALTANVKKRMSEIDEYQKELNVAIKKIRKIL